MEETEGELVTMGCPTFGRSSPLYNGMYALSKNKDTLREKILAERNFSEFGELPKNSPNFLSAKFKFIGHSPKLILAKFRNFIKSPNTIKKI